ncbi:hypothetical protein P7C70_g4800, partial [Phenoliferia sp. Uapishka_3]
MSLLRVQIGPHRFHLTTASVNSPNCPTIISTPSFIGRVSVFVKDFTGVTPDGSAPIKDCSYFEGRSRKFAILIEGRFKEREGVRPYDGDELQFGSDFDFLPDSFPRAPFAVGMKIAKVVDPATEFNEKPLHGRPYIMSPYLGAMNTLCAYPAPDALERAVFVANREGEVAPRDEEGRVNGGFVPFEELENGKRKERNPWRYIGLKGDPKVDQFVSTNPHLIATPTISSPTFAPNTSASQHSIDTPPQTSRTQLESPPTSPKSNSPTSSSGSTHSNTPVKEKHASKFSLAGLKAALDSNDGPDTTLQPGDLVSGSEFLLKDDGLEGGNDGDEVERLLGPWKFGASGVNAMEDSTFVFLDPEHPRSVSQRRKYFASDDGVHRKEFSYEPNT